MAPQQKMTQSSYGKGFGTGQQKQPVDIKYAKMPAQGASRQPHPDISIKKSGSSNTSSQQQQQPGPQMYNVSQLTPEQKMMLMQMQKKGQVPQA